MKSIIKYLTLGLMAAMGVASCSDEFLEDKKNYDMSGPEVYDYVSGVNARINDIYSWCLPQVNDLNWKFVSIGLADAAGKSTEEYSGFSAFVDPNGSANQQELNNATPIDVFNNQSQNIQESVYGRIRNINDAIEGISAGKLSQKDKDKFLGQAYFFRAWCYYNLVKWYGGVPLVKEVLFPSADAHTPRSSAKECIDFMIEDLEKASEMLAEYTTDGGWRGNDYGRVTAGTALALKGRILLMWASPLFNRANDPQRWQKAYEEMTKDLPTINACGYGLFNTGSNINGSVFANIFSQSGHNPEAILVTLHNIVVGNGLDTQKNNSWERHIRPANTGGSGMNPSSMLIDLFPMADGKVPATAGTYTKLAKSETPYDPELPFMNRDPRFYRTFAFPGFRWAYNGDASIINPNNPSNGKNYILWNYAWYTDEADRYSYENKTAFGADNLLSSRQGVYVRKKSDDLDANSNSLYTYSYQTYGGAEPFFSAAQLIEFRYAEVLLNLAEVACMAGHADEAVEYLKQIRARAGYTAENNYGLQLDLASDQATCMSAILYERQIEFAYEGKRFDDCRRWMLYDGGAGVKDIIGAPSTWTVTGWGGNTCTWLGFTPLNGQRRDNISFELSNKYPVGGSTYDSDPLLKQMTKDERDAVAVDLRKDLEQQLKDLSVWYRTNLKFQKKAGDGRDSNQNPYYIHFHARNYFIGLPGDPLNKDKKLEQTIGWENTAVGDVNGTFDPLAE